MDDPILMAIRISQWLLAGAVVLAAVYGVWTVFCHNVHASILYVIEARFEKMPPNDKALREWLRSQPGVHPRVEIGRFEDGKLLYISFGMSRSLAGQPPVPDLDGHIASLGYAGPDGPFRGSADLSRTTTDETWR